MHRFCVPEELMPYVGEALLRLRYLHPSVSAEQAAAHIAWTLPPDSEPTDVERELTYLLYRAKIHAEGQAQRATLSRMVFSA